MTDTTKSVAPVPGAAEPQTDASRSGRAARLRPSLGRYTGAVVGFTAVFLYLSITEPAFLTWDNFRNIAAANSVVLLLAIGATFVVISAGIDLSVASATTACAMILGITMQQGWDFVPVLLVTLLFGVGLGLLNGFCIGGLKIPFFVVTLGTLSIYSSFALVVQDGATITLFGLPAFNPIKDLVNNDVGPISALMLLDLLALCATSAVLRYTRFGRAVYAVGSNPEAARLAGIRVGAVLVGVYAIAGLFAALGSVVQAGRLAGATPNVDPTLLLTVIAAVLIGGTSYTGGVGGVFGTLIGVLFLGVVQNGLALTNVSSFWQGTVSGVILIVAVGIGVQRSRRWRLGSWRSVRWKAQRPGQDVT